MSTTARKQRRREGIPFAKPAKIPTPVAQRAFATMPVQRFSGDAMPAGAPKYSTHRSPARVAAFIASGGIKNPGAKSGGAR